MADFSVADKFNAEKQYNEIVIGGGAAALEIDMIELQKIQNYKRNLLGKQLLQNGFCIKNPLGYAGQTLTVAPDVISVNGDVLDIKNSMTLAGLAENDKVYLDVWDEEIDYTDTIYRSGNTSNSETITNDLIDFRVGTETTRRIQTKVQLTITNAGTAGHAYLPVCTVLASGISDSRVNANPYTTESPTAHNTSAANALVVTVNGVSDLTIGTTFDVISDYTNTAGVVTIAVNGLAAKFIKNPDGTDLSAGQIVAGVMFRITYTGTYFEWSSLSAVLGSTRAAVTGSLPTLLLHAPYINAYVAGMHILFKMPVTSTGLLQVNVNNLGVKAVKKNVSKDIEAGDIYANQLVSIFYDGTNFQTEIQKEMNDSEYSIYRSQFDSNDKPQIIQWKRADGTLALQSALSGGTSPCYALRTITQYAYDGTTVISTITKNITWSGNLFVSEVLA